MPVNILFDLLAPIYDRVFQEPSLEELKERLALPTNGWLLDVGGGTGRVSNQVRPFVDHLLIADLSRPMLSQAKRKHDCCFLRSSANRLPFINERFERVLVVDALHHFNDQPKVIEELLRILRPGGRLVIQEPDIHKLAVKAVALMEKLALMDSHFHTWQQIKTMFEKKGYQPVVHLDSAHAVWVVVDK